MAGGADDNPHIEALDGCDERRIIPELEARAADQSFFGNRLRTPEIGVHLIWDQDKLRRRDTKLVYAKLVLAPRVKRDAGHVRLDLRPAEKQLLFRCSDAMADGDVR